MPHSLFSLMQTFSHGHRSQITASLVVPRTFPDAGRTLLYIDHKHHVRPLHFSQAVARNSHTRNRHCIRWCQVHVREASAAADLLLVHLKRVTVCHFEGLRVVRWVHSGAVEQEATASDVLALALTECVHELLQLGCALDLEEHFIVVVGDLDVQMFGGLGLFLLACWGG